MFSNYLQELLQIVYPTICAACNNQLPRSESILCISCQLALPYTNYWQIRQNKIEQKLWGRFEFNRAAALLFFEKQGGVQRMLHSLKYKGKSEIGVYLGEMLAQKLMEGHWPKPDVITFVPLHWKKEKLRGYNQCLFIANGINNVWNVPVVPDVIQRVKASESQTRKNMFDRLENVQDIFELSKPDVVRNKSVLLIDDVLTTGATIEACAATLHQAGGVQLNIATIAFSV